MIFRSSCVTRLMTVVLLCGPLAGCAAIAAWAVTQATVWALGETAVSAGLGGAVAIAGGVESRHCDEAIHRGATVADVDRKTLLTSRSTSREFEPTLWQPATVRYGWLEADPDASPVEGVLAITETSILFVPAGETLGFRVPYDLVLQVSLHESAVTALVIQSCLGRVDRFTFWKSGRRAMDTKATADAAAALKQQLDLYHPIKDEATQK